MSAFPRILIGLCSLLTTPAAPAALIAQYVFTDGNLLDNDANPGVDDLTLTTGGPSTVTISPAGAAVFPGDDAPGDQDYLEVERGLGAGAFTVSFWFRTSQVDQGSFQGLLSNNNTNTAGNFSWQVDVHSGTLRLVSATANFGALTNGEAGEPPITADTWHHVVARKTGGGGQLWFGTQGDLQLVGSSTENPGGLQFYRLGVNRNSDSLYAMEMANIQVWDDDNVSLDSLNTEGPLLVPEPGAAFLSLLATVLLFPRRRR